METDGGEIENLYISYHSHVHSYLTHNLPIEGYISIPPKINTKGTKRTYDDKIKKNEMLIIREDPRLLEKFLEYGITFDEQTKILYLIFDNAMRHFSGFLFNLVNKLSFEINTTYQLIKNAQTYPHYNDTVKLMIDELNKKQLLIKCINKLKAIISNGEKTKENDKHIKMIMFSKLCNILIDFPSNNELYDNYQNYFEEWICVIMSNIYNIMKQHILMELEQNLIFLKSTKTASHFNRPELMSLNNTLANYYYKQDLKILFLKEIIHKYSNLNNEINGPLSKVFFFIEQSCFRELIDESRNDLNKYFKTE
jgi:hypothetical protein